MGELESSGGLAFLLLVGHMSRDGEGSEMGWREGMKGYIGLTMAQRVEVRG